MLTAHTARERTGDLFRTAKDTDRLSMTPKFRWTDDKVRAHVLLCLCSVMLADSAGVKLTKHTLLDRLGKVRDGWVIVDGKSRRAIEDLETRERRLWDAVVALPGEALGVDDWHG